MMSDLGIGLNLFKLKKILILYPHFPPSNLAGVHRPRLFAQHLSQFGWEPTVLTVHEDFYEETLDHNLTTLLPYSLRIEKVWAFRIGAIRLIGDIGLRAFFQLYSRAEKLIKKERFDFLYIPVPSFYCALLGRWLHETTGVKYGIDYIDPWVHQFPGSEKKFSRHWWSTKLSRFLEPIAVKKASLITGVAEGYYDGVRIRNPHLSKTCLFGAMPYGGEKSDHEKVRQLGTAPYLFQKKAGRLQLVYAGAMLPKAFAPLKKILKAIHDNQNLFKNVEFHFIGTGKTPNDHHGYNIKTIAEEFGLWQSSVFEYPARIPYMDVLSHLEAASGVFILGSTEPHYTPSKVYQAILSEKPIFAVLHEKSSALAVLAKTGVGVKIGISEEKLDELLVTFPEAFKQFIGYSNYFSTHTSVLSEFDSFSAKEVTKKLAVLLNTIVPG